MIIFVSGTIDIIFFRLSIFQYSYKNIMINQSRYK